MSSLLLGSLTLRDTTDLLREGTHTDPSPGTSQNVLPTQPAKKIEGLAAGVKGESLGQSKHRRSPRHNCYGQMPNAKQNAPLVTRSPGSRSIS